MKKLKDFLSSVSENKKNKQKTASFKSKALREAGLSVDELLDMEIMKGILK